MLTPAPLLLSTLFASGLTFLSDRVVRRLAIAAFALTTLSVPLAILGCWDAEGGTCSAAPAGILLVLSLPLLFAALSILLLRAARPLSATNLGRLEGWKAPSFGFLWAYLVGLAGIALTALVGLIAQPNWIRAVSAVLAVAVVLWRLLPLLRAHDMLWMPPAAPKKLQLASLSAFVVTSIFGAYVAIAAHIPGMGQLDGFVALAAVAQPALLLLFLCGIELPRGAAARQATLARAA